MQSLPRMPLSGRVTILVNDSSRGAFAVRRGGVEDACARAGLEARVVRVGHFHLMAAAERAAHDSDVLIAAGGDGTVSSVATVAVKAKLTFGVIPLGTLNHFARDAGIPRSLDAALQVIAAGHTAQLDVADVNDAVFTNNASLGMYPRLVWERRVEEAQGRGWWTAFAIALTRALRRYRVFDVRLDVDGRSLTRRTPFVFVGNGDYRVAGLEVGTRRSIAAGRLSVFIAPMATRFDAVALPFRALVNRLPVGDGFEALSATEVTIDMARREVGLALDGELMLAPPPFRCTVRPGALRTLVPEARD